MLFWSPLTPALKLSKLSRKSNSLLRMLHFFQILRHGCHHAEFFSAKYLLTRVCNQKGISFLPFLIISQINLISKFSMLNLVVLLIREPLASAQFGYTVTLPCYKQSGNFSEVMRKKLDTLLFYISSYTLKYNRKQKNTKLVRLFIHLFKKTKTMIF